MDGREVREILKRERLYQWELAKELAVSEFTLSRWLRTELPVEREEAILKAVEQLKVKKGW